MNDPYVKRVMSIGIFLVLLVLAFLILKPILLSIVLGFLLAFVLTPIYNFFVKYFKSPNFSSGLTCVLVVLIILIPIWFFSPIVLEQSFKLYLAAQNFDFITPLKSVFPGLFASEQFSVEIGSTIQSFISNVADYLVKGVGSLILEFPTLLLHAVVVLFTLFFVLRDRDHLTDFLRKTLPFPKPIVEKIFQYSKDITSSVLYGQVVLGILQGIIVGIGFFIFGAPSPWLLTLLAIVLGILPIIGPMFVWVPVCIYFLTIGNIFGVVGLFIVGLIGSNSDTFFRPFFVSKKTKIHSAVVLIGMIGGLFFFGILGLLLGPLFLSYLLILLEVYKENNTNN